MQFLNDFYDPTVVSYIQNLSSTLPESPRQAALVVSTGAALLFRRNRNQANKLIWPLKGAITSAFGNCIHSITNQSDFHNGIDIACGEGAPILAPADGCVTSLYTNATGGKQLVISHDNGFLSDYAHLSKYTVKMSDRIYESDVIAYVGNTDQLTGPHLHFALKDAKGNYLNAVEYLTCNT